MEIKHIRIRNYESDLFKSNQIKSLLLSHHHSTSALVSEILTSVLQTVQKNKTTIYIWTVHIYRLYRRQCAKYTYIYSVHLVYYKDILSYRYTLYTVFTRLHYVHIYAQYYVKVQQIINLQQMVVQQIVVQRCNRLFICNIMDVHCMISSDSR